MTEFKKRIDIDKNRILIYRISEGYIKPVFTISEGFIENGVVKKIYNLCQWDDYGLNGWTSDDNDINKLSFEFDINHPLYLPFLHLLNYDEKLIIDDDDTVLDNKKYMIIYRTDDKIFMEFLNNLDDNTYKDKFYVFIKNIGPDGRSKIDCLNKDTKTRLFDFFNEVYEVLTNDSHQISVEEYLLRDYKNDESNEVIKGFKRSRKY